MKAVTENPVYHEPDENGFVGVSAEYSNYANDTEKPLSTEFDSPVEVQAAAEELVDDENADPALVQTVGYRLQSGEDKEDIKDELDGASPDDSTPDDVSPQSPAPASKKAAAPAKASE